MTHELKALSKLLQSNSLEILSKYGRNNQLFLALKPAYSFIVDHYFLYGKLPNLKTFKDKFNDIDFISDLPEPIDFYFKELADFRRKTILEKIKIDLVQEHNVENIEILVKNTLNELSLVKSVTNYSFKETRDDRLRRYEELKAKNGLLGIQTRWETFNKLSGGLQLGHLVALVGKRYTGKTWIGLLLAYDCIINGYKCLFVALEQGSDEISQRLDAIRYNLPYDDFKKGRLDFTFEGKFKEEDKYEDIQDLIFLEETDQKGFVGISLIAEKVIEYGCQVVIIDGGNRLGDDRITKQDSKVTSLTHITEDLKKLTRRQRLLIIVITHLQRDKKGSLDSIMWSDSWASDSDVVLRVEKDKSDERTRDLYFDKQREGKEGGFTIDFDIEDGLYFKEIAKIEEQLNSLDVEY